jgi:hypothetical protein
LALLALLLAPAGRVRADDEPLESVVDLARLTVISARLMGQAKAVEAMGTYGFAKDMEQGGTRSIINLAFGDGPRVFVSAG